MNISNDTAEHQIIQIQTVETLALQVFGDETLVSEWMSTPNDLFFGYSPVEMILGGRFEGVLSFLNDLDANRV